MNKTAIYIYLKSKSNRENLIKKIDDGFKNKSIEYDKDPEVEEFQKGFLMNWNNLENFPPAYEDLKDVSKENMKEEIKKLKLNFCEWISGDDAIMQGYSYAYNKKEQMKDSMKSAGNNVLLKTKKAIEVVTGKKVGRNEKCPCGSNLKYKKCCGVQK